MRRKWLSSSEALDGIVGTLGAQALALRRMQDEPYQVSRWEEMEMPRERLSWGRPYQLGSGFSGNT